jgi:hypothetical protein
LKGSNEAIWTAAASMGSDPELDISMMRIGKAAGLAGGMVTVMLFRDLDGVMAEAKALR